MYTVEDIRTEYAKLDRICGIDSSEIELSISGRLSRRLGYFKVIKRPGLFKKAELSIVIAKLICNDENLFYDTIRHEYAHALVYLKTGNTNHGHDKLWKDACKLVGCRPKASVKIENEEIKGQLNNKRKYHYMLRCSKCGKEFYYVKDCNAVKIASGRMAGMLRCPVCKNTKMEVYKLIQ